MRLTPLPHPTDRLSMFSLWLTLVPLLAFGATKEACQESYARFLENAHAPLQAIGKEALQLPDASLRARFLATAEKLSDDQIRAIFSGPQKLSFQDLDDLWWAGQTRLVKIDKETMAYLTFLREIGRRAPGLFAEGRRDIPAFFRRTVKMALEGKGGLEHNLVQTEETLLMQAILEGRGIRNASNAWYDRFLNFFSPHSQRLQELLHFNNNMRRSTQQFGLADEPVADALAKYAEHLNPGERQALDGLLADTQAQVRQQSDKIKEVYGKDLTREPAPDLGDIRLRTIAVKAEEAGSDKQFAEAVLQSERDMDQVEAIANAAQKRTGAEGRKMEEIHPRELQIRHNQWRRETGELNEAHSAMLRTKVPNSDYRVTAEWTVTVNHQQWKTRQVSRRQPDGSTKTETENYLVTWTSHYPMRGSFSLDASYREVINGTISPSTSRVESMLPSASPRGMYAVSASNGSPTIVATDQRATSAILQRAAKARAVEKPVEAKLDQFAEVIEKIRDEHAKGNLEQTRERHLAAFARIRSELDQMRAAMWDQYRNKSDGAVRSDWTDDTLEHFRARVKLLEDRYARIGRLADYTHEQVARGMPDLQPRYDLPTYARQEEELERIRHRARVVQAVGGGTAGTAAAGGGLYASDEDRRRDLGRRLDIVSKNARQLFQEP